MPERRKAPKNESQIFFQRKTQPEGNMIKCERKNIERRGNGDRLAPAKHICFPYINNVSDLNQMGNNFQVLYQGLGQAIHAIQMMANVVERRK